ncbi:hypothetical protein [Modestobacter sp. NPDC049651]|uniref:hypothetical protein n=1 Tax=unclassified Modestobacter TaxID=2643866 RepID=UPI0033DFFB72
MADRLDVTVRSNGTVVVLCARGDVREEPQLLGELVGVALAALDDRPAVVDVSDLYVQRHAGLDALRRLLRQRPPGAPTVVLARTALRRRLVGVFGPDTAWYPSEVHTPWLGVAASLAHRRHHLPRAGLALVEDPLSELLWAAARERATGQEPGGSSSRVPSAGA